MKCKKCGVEFTPEKGLKNYCSLKCRNSKKWIEADKVSRSIKLKEYWSTTDKAKRGKPSKRKITFCEICGKEKPNHLKTCSRECFSKLAQKNALKQKKHGNGKKGRYKGFRLDSTYELAFLVYHLEHGNDIKNCELKIPYSYKGKEHLYNPDFEINGKIYEIKGWLNKRSKVKLKSAKEQGYDIILIPDLKKYINYTKTKYGTNFYENLYEDIKRRKCLNCDNLVKGNSKFCSISCSRKYNGHQPKRKVEINGVIFNSVSEARNNLKISPTTMNQKLKSKLCPEWRYI